LDIWEKEGIEQAMDFYYDYQKKKTWGLTPMRELFEKLNAGLVLTIENQSIENELLTTKTSAINMKNIDSYIYDQEIIAFVSENLTENDYN
jgi:hypothetical protein